MLSGTLQKIFILRELIRAHGFDAVSPDSTVRAVTTELSRRDLELPRPMVTLQLDGQNSICTMKDLTYDIDHCSVINQL